MSIWKKPIDLDILNATSKNTMMEHLQIVYTDFTDDSLTATMPVCSFTHQPLGMLHGGASVVLAETLGSLAANFCVGEGSYCVVLVSTSMQTIFEPCAAGTLLARRSRFTWVYRLKYGKSK